MKSTQNESRKSLIEAVQDAVRVAAQKVWEERLKMCCYFGLFVVGSSYIIKLVHLMNDTCI